MWDGTWNGGRHIQTSLTLSIGYSDIWRSVDNPRPLSNSPAATVAGPPSEPLTASFSGMPSEHAGEGTFTFGLTFSDEVTLSYKTLRAAALNVSGGAVRKAEREQQGSNLAWEITVEPASAGAVTIGLPETTDCDASGAICTVDGRPLSHSLSATIAGPVGMSVADARVVPSWGGQATGGAEALWGRQTMAGMAQDGVANGSRLDAEVGYGLPLGSRFVGTPRIGVAATEHGREYRLGYGLGVLDRESLNLELGVDAHRRESPTLNGTDNAFLGRATLGW